MNEQYDNTNTGVLFKNDKDGNEKRPDYKGSVNIEGTDYWLSAWIKTKRDGSGKFMSLKAERKEQQQAPPPQNQHNVAKQNAYQPEREMPDGEDIPF